MRRRGTATVVPNHDRTGARHPGATHEGGTTMRKAVILIMAMGLVAALVAPAAAQKKKTVEEEWTATAPVPGPAAQVDPSTCGIENASFVSHPFSTPGKGVLDVSMDQFVGDWDLYVRDGDGNTIGSSTGFV